MTDIEDPLDYYAVYLWAHGSDNHDCTWWSRMELSPGLRSLPISSFWHVLEMHVKALIEDMVNRDVPIENIKWDVTVDLMTVREKLEYNGN